MGSETSAGETMFFETLDAYQDDYDWSMFEDDVPIGDFGGQSNFAAEKDLMMIRDLRPPEQAHAAEISKPELKPLPSNLVYAFLDDEET